MAKVSLAANCSQHNSLRSLHLQHQPTSGHFDRFFCLQVNFTGQKAAETEGEAMVRELQAGNHEVDRQLDEPTIRLLQNGVLLNPAHTSLASTPESSDDEAGTYSF